MVLLLDLIQSPTQGMVTRYGHVIIVDEDPCLMFTTFVNIAIAIALGLI
jgi:hypothetical protein